MMMGVNFNLLKVFSDLEINFRQNETKLKYTRKKNNNNKNSIQINNKFSNLILKNHNFKDYSFNFQQNKPREFLCI